MKSRLTRQEREQAKAKVAAAEYRSALLRMKMVKVGLERNNFVERHVPPLAKQLLLYSAPSWFLQNERGAIEAAIEFAKKCIVAALANVYVQQAIEQKLTTVAEIRSHTPVALEFEHAVSIADLGTCVSCSGSKNSFGRCIGIRPLEVETPCHHERILYLYRYSSLYNRRIEQRLYLKARLDRRRVLVSLAMRNTKGEFVADNQDAVLLIQEMFEMSLGRFWRVVRGKEFIEIPKQRLQLLLPFD